MRSLFFCFCGTLLMSVLLILNGCSAIPGLQPLVTLPVVLDDVAVNPTRGAMQRITVDFRDSLVEYNDAQIVYEGVTLAMQIVNRTGVPANPDEAHVRCYLSDRGDLTADSLQMQQPLLDALIPAGMQILNYNSGTIPLTSAQKTIIKDGRCYLYVLGSPTASVDLDATLVELGIRMRISVI